MLVQNGMYPTTYPLYSMIKDAVLATYIQQVATFPNLPHVFLLTEPEKQFFELERFAFKAISLWLQHLLLGEALAEKAFLTDMKYYQPDAELAEALFRLAVGVHPRTANPVIRQFNSPADLWFYSMGQFSQAGLGMAGLTNKPALMGKRELYKDILKAISLLEDLSLPYQEEELSKFRNLTRILILEAQEITRARSNLDFQKDYFRPFLRKLKGSVNKNKNCKALQLPYLLPDGRLFWTGKNSKLPQM